MIGENAPCDFRRWLWIVNLGSGFCGLDFMSSVIQVIYQSLTPVYKSRVHVNTIAKPFCFLSYRFQLGGETASTSIEYDRSCPSHESV